MKQISFEHLEKPVVTKSAPRNQKEDLIAQIISYCTFRSESERKNLAKMIAITANTADWTTTDLHALLQKRNDPTIRSYTAFVRWSAKIQKK